MSKVHSSSNQTNRWTVKYRAVTYMTVSAARITQNSLSFARGAGVSGTRSLRYSSTYTDSGDKTGLLNGFCLNRPAPRTDEEVGHMATDRARWLRKILGFKPYAQSSR